MIPEKIVIFPHYCTEEEYGELIDFLERECWDYREVQNGEKSKEDK